MLSRLRSLRPLLPIACIAAACGGNVIVDEVGAGGSGGAPSTSSSMSTSSSTVTNTSTSVTTSSVSTSSGPSGCDNTGECGDSVSGCLGCALAGQCAGLQSECFNSDACLDFATCLDPCAQQGQACIDQCKASFPAGVSPYAAIFDCIRCEVCPIDCVDVPYTDPEPGCP